MKKIKKENLANFISRLAENILNNLKEMSKKLAVPKSKIIEKTLEIYPVQLNRAEYVKSYRMAGEDQNIIEMAEEGISGYLNQLEEV